MIEMMDSTFTNLFRKQDWNQITSLIKNAGCAEVERALTRKGRGGLVDFAALLSACAGEKYLEPMAQLSKQMTRRRFGNAIRLFAPLYLSNECNNICDYCGFSLGNDIPRKTLSTSEILREAGILRKQGFEHILLVTGESSAKVGVDYLANSLRTLRPYFSNLSIEAQPLKKQEYEKLISEGLHAVMVYQETYERESYAAHHIKGKKRNFDWRLETPDRLGQAGVNKIGLGCLFGLTQDWRTDAYFAGLHLDYLEKKYWRTTYSMSFPRIRPFEGETMPMADLSDRDLVQLFCAFRIFKEELELTLSTRERPAFRENLLPLGVTTMSAGSKTNPGGYAGEEDSLEQFSTSDDRSASEVRTMLSKRGYDPVWKDWDSSYDFVRSSASEDVELFTEGRGEALSLVG
jgi:2-iminoacetate synthase